MVGWEGPLIHSSYSSPDFTFVLQEISRLQLVEGVLREGQLCALHSQRELLRISAMISTFTSALHSRTISTTNNANAVANTTKVLHKAQSNSALL